MNLLKVLALLQILSAKRVLTRNMDSKSDPKGLDSFIDMIAANEQKIHNGIASGKFDGPDRHDRDDPEDNYGHLMLQELSDFRKVKIPGVDYNLEPVPIPIEVIEINEVEEQDDDKDEPEDTTRLPDDNANLPKEATPECMRSRKPKPECYPDDSPPPPTPDPSPPQQTYDDNMHTEPPIHHEDHTPDPHSDHAEAPTERPDITYMPETTERPELPISEPEFQPHRFEDLLQNNEHKDEKDFESDVGPPERHPNSEHHINRDSDGGERHRQHNDRHSGLLPHSHPNEFVDNTAKKEPLLTHNDPNDQGDHIDHHDHNEHEHGHRHREHDDLNHPRDHQVDKEPNDYHDYRDRQQKGYVGQNDNQDHIEIDNREHLDNREHNREHKDKDNGEHLRDDRNTQSHNYHIDDHDHHHHHGHDDHHNDNHGPNESHEPHDHEHEIDPGQGQPVDDRRAPQSQGQQPVSQPEGGRPSDDNPGGFLEFDRNYFVTPDPSFEPNLRNEETTTTPAPVINRIYDMPIIQILDQPVSGQTNPDKKKDEPKQEHNHEKPEHKHEGRDHDDQSKVVHLDFDPSKPEAGAHGDQIMKYYEDQSKVDSKRLTQLAKDSEQQRRHHIGGKREVSNQFEHYKNTNEPQVINENKQIDKRVGFSERRKNSEPKKYYRKNAEQTPELYSDRPTTGSRVYGKKEEYSSNEPNYPQNDEEVSDVPNDEYKAYDKLSDEYLRFVEEELKKDGPITGNDHKPPPYDLFRPPPSGHKDRVPDSHDYENARSRPKPHNDVTSGKRHYERDSTSPRDLNQHHNKQLQRDYDREEKQRHEHYSPQHHSRPNSGYDKEAEDPIHYHRHDEPPPSPEDPQPEEEPNDYHRYHNDRQNTNERNNEDNYQSYREDQNSNPNEDQMPATGDYRQNGDQLERRPDEDYHYDPPEKSIPVKPETSGHFDAMTPQNTSGLTNSYQDYDNQNGQEVNGAENPDHFRSDYKPHQSSTPPSDMEYERKEYRPQRDRQRSQSPPHRHYSHPHQSHESYHSHDSHETPSEEYKKDKTPAIDHNDQRRGNYYPVYENSNKFRHNSDSKSRSVDNQSVKSVKSRRPNHSDDYYSEREVRDDYNDRNRDDRDRQSNQEPTQSRYGDRNRRKYSRGRPQYYDEEKAATDDSLGVRADPKTGRFVGSESMEVLTQTNSSLNDNNDNNNDTIAIKAIDSVSAWVKPLSLKTKAIVIDDKNDTLVAQTLRDGLNNANDGKEKSSSLGSNDKKRTRNITRKPKLQKLINLHNIANKSLINDVLIKANNSSESQSESESQHRQQSEQSEPGYVRTSAHQLSETVRPRSQRSISHKIINSVRNSNDSDNYESTKNSLNVSPLMANTTASSEASLSGPKCSELSPIANLCVDTDYEYPLQSMTKNLMKNLGNVRNLQRMLNSSDVGTAPSGDRCSAPTINIHPLRAKDISGKWKVIVNIAGLLEQRLDISNCREEAEEESKECESNGHKYCSKCIQKYSSNGLIAYNEESSGFGIDIFHMPSVCRCSATKTNII